MGTPQEEMKKLKSQGPGRTMIADSVVAKIASIAAREVPGVHDLGAPAARVIGGAISRITGAPMPVGVNVEVGEEEAAVDVNLIVDYGQAIPEVTDRVRKNIINQIQSMTGLRVKEVNIAVNDLFFPQQQQQQAGESEQRAA
ncbi:MAG: Asp23/Gls24 family envelope stress response protein [Actinomycetota bacterium]|nr:Asp23/Gls24 family envelope stress response protein [Actinomycetota bacterium]